MFRHTQGLEAGVNRVTIGPDGAIYVGGLGADGNWGQAGKLRYGLQKLTPNGTNTFDMKSMSATRDGFRSSTPSRCPPRRSRTSASKYRLTQWRYARDAAYGGPKVDEETLTVTARRSRATARPSR